MKVLFLAIIALFQIGCVSTVRSTTDGEMYYKVTIPFTLDVSPTGIAREAGNFYNHTQETTTTYRDNMTQKEASKRARDFVVENAPSGGVRDVINVYEAVQVTKVIYNGVNNSKEPTCRPVIENENITTFRDLMDVLFNSCEI